MRNANFETADEDFLDRYGPDILAVVQPRSKAAEYFANTTKQGAQWVIEHPGIERLYPPHLRVLRPHLRRPEGLRLPAVRETASRRRPGPVGPRCVGAADEPDQRRHPVVQEESVEGHENTEEGRVPGRCAPPPLRRVSGLGATRPVSPSVPSST